MSKKVLVVSAHAADWCTRSGGLLIRYKQLGYHIELIVLTYGEKGESGSYWKTNPSATLDEVKQCRREETDNAVRFIGIDRVQYLDYGDYPLVMDATRLREMTKYILSYRPDIVLTHWVNDPFNEDHEIAGKSVVRAISSAGMRGAFPNTDPHFIPDVFFFETTVPHSEFNKFEINTYINIDTVFEQKMDAIRSFSSQPQLLDYYQRYAIVRGAQAHDWSRGRRSIRYAEGYYRYTPYVGEILPLTTL